MRFIKNILSLIILGIFILLAFGSDKDSSSPKSDSIFQQPVASTKPSNPALPLVEIKNFRPYKSGSGVVMLADFIIKNGSGYNIKDITITCTHYANSGTRIDSNTRTIYESIKAGKTKSIKNFNMGFIHSQVASSSCKIDDLKID
jgi:hypothetical protein